MHIENIYRAMYLSLLTTILKLIRALHITLPIAGEMLFQSPTPCGKCSLCIPVRFSYAR